MLILFEMIVVFVADNSFTECRIHDAVLLDQRMGSTC